MKCVFCHCVIMRNGIAVKGNSAVPINKKRCCDWCNAKHVAPAKWKLIKQKTRGEKE